MADRRPARPTAARRDIRVLHICRRYAPLSGGTERYVGDLATAQAAAGRRVTVLTLDRDVTGVQEGELARAEQLDGVTVVRVPGWGSDQLAVTGRPDLALGALRRADVVHLHDLRFLFGATGLVALARRTPWILHTHGLIFHTERWAALKRLAMRMYFGPLLRAGRAWVVASSATDRATLLRHAPQVADRVCDFDNAIALAPLLGLRRRPKPGRIVSIGRVVASKGIGDLLSAMATVDLPWQLEVAGTFDPAERARLERQAGELKVADRVRFSGPFPADRLASLLGGARVAAFPSRSEGFGLALLEAMAAGVPLVARDIPPHASLLGPELASRLVDFGDPAGAGAAIRRLLSADARELGAMSRSLRARAAAYDIARLVAQIDELYARIGVASGSGRP